jgi:CheY-like chemotaxis protein
MSHELRTPLNAIIGFSQIIKEQTMGVVGVPRYVEYANDIYTAGEHLLALINNVLDISKIQAGKVSLKEEPIDLHETVQGSLTAVAAQALKNKVALHVELPEALPPVHADAVAMRQILINLLSNAVKFTPDGGKVWLESRPGGPGMTEFCVGDTGIGIAPEDHAAIFDKFRQVSSSTRGVREGTGLGLAIVKSYVEMHGGTISLESAPGEGSRFTFTIPAGDETPPMVLVIEDEAGARELMASYLEPLGIRTETAATADEGIRIARDLKPDAITLDVLMPGKSGWRALRELRALPETAETPIFVVSVLDESPAMTGATEYLQKPLRREALLQALRRHIPSRFPAL